MNTSKVLYIGSAKQNAQRVPCTLCLSHRQLFAKARH